jgi:ParB family chromosome partitioning protein
MRVQPARAKAKAKGGDSQTFVLADGKKGVIRAGKGGAVTVELPKWCPLSAALDLPSRTALAETAGSELPEAP